MQVFKSSVSAVYAQIFANKFSHGVVGGSGSRGEGILLRGLPLHLAEGRFQAFRAAAEHGAILFYRGSGTERFATASAAARASAPGGVGRIANRPGSRRAGPLLCCSDSQRVRMLDNARNKLQR